MAQLVGRLTALKVDRIKKPGMYADGNGLYLQVTGDGDKRVAKPWIYRFMFGGKEYYMGLGSLSALGIADARIKATECRRVRLEGLNPIETRRAERAHAALEAARAVTFEACADQHIKAHRAAWRNEKHAAQWESTLQTYAYLIIGSAPVQGVDTALDWAS